MKERDGERVGRGKKVGEGEGVEGLWWWMIELHCGMLEEQAINKSSRLVVREV